MADANHDTIDRALRNGFVGVAITPQDLDDPLYMSAYRFGQVTWEHARQDAHERIRREMTANWDRLSFRGVMAPAGSVEVTG